jgi:RNA polymerase sigma-70 factor, ECF subfamily
MSKYAVVVMSEHGEGNPGGQGRMVHALSTVKELIDAGEEVSLWFHGIGVGWLSALDARYDAFTRHYGPPCSTKFAASSVVRVRSVVASAWAPRRAPNVLGSRRWRQRQPSHGCRSGPRRMARRHVLNLSARRSDTLANVAHRTPMRTADVGASTSDPASPVGAEVATLVVAQTGDQQAFGALLAPYRRDLHLHCYRMLGNIHDADDAFQETLLRAWRGLPGFEPRATLRAWLFRIATNVCFSAMTARSTARRRAAVEQMYDRIGLYPDALLEEHASLDLGPERTFERDSSVELALVASVQLLPARQRAVLLLRDVLDFSANEVAGLLGATVAALNSALQRARATVHRERQIAHVSRTHTPASVQVEGELVQSFARASRAGDINGLVRLLVDDAVVTTPPNLLRVEGHRQVAEFLISAPAGGRFDRLRLVPTRANHQPAVAAYLHDPSSGHAHPYAVVVLAVQHNAVASICRFGDPARPNRALRRRSRLVAA